MIQDDLYALQDADYRDFQLSLMPTVDQATVIGVRMPLLRQYAKTLQADGRAEAFLQALPHEFYEENVLHALLLSGMKDYAGCLAGVKAFLPYVDNWAVCDGLSPKVFAGHHKELLAEIPAWLASDEPYTVRFGIRMLMDHFLKEDFDPVYPGWVAALRREEYYVNMMIAWYFATALALRYEETLPYLTEHRLATWTHNKAIQKALESYRVPDGHKDDLRTLRSSTRRSWT